MKKMQVSDCDQMCICGNFKRYSYRPTWVEINRGNFIHNIKEISSFLKPKVKILAVIKANAYGHSALGLSKLAVSAGASALGVSSVEEGLHLRENGITSPILVLGSTYPMKNFGVMAANRLVPTVSSQQGIEALAALAGRMKKCLPFHLKVDTGMGRIGVSPGNALRLLDKIKQQGAVAMQGLYTHFSSAGDDPAFTRNQIRSFKAVDNYAKSIGLKFVSHAANSAAVIKYPESHFDMVRPGISLYGLSPFSGAGKVADLRPVLSWKTKVVFLKRVKKGAPISYSGTFRASKNSLIATLPVGYADGYNRLLSNNAEVLVRGVRCPVVGRVTMDMIMADVTGARGAEIGDETVLIGTQGKENIACEEMAKLAGTINYEITCSIGWRVPRVLT